MIGRDRQTMADMAVEHCGSAESLFRIARRNRIAIDTEVVGLELENEPIADVRTQDLIAGTGVSPAGMYEITDDVLVADDLENDVVTEDDETIVQ
jgi:hypothetical protein